MRLLVLIIASDNLPVYKSLQELWKKQFRIHPEIDTYFLKCDPTLPEEYKKTEDTIYVKEKEDLNYGILYKTLIGIKVAFLEKEYDYVLRTNLSSFYVFPRLLTHLESCPREGYYGGITGKFEHYRYVSGCGFVLSKDLALHISDKINQIWDPKILWDDVCIGHYIDKTFFSNKDFYYIPRTDFTNIAPKRLPSSIHQSTDPHFRIKYNNHRDIDIYARSLLLRHFYPATH